MLPGKCRHGRRFGVRAKLAVPASLTAADVLSAELLYLVRDARGRSACLSGRPARFGVALDEAQTSAPEGEPLASGSRRLPHESAPRFRRRLGDWSAGG